MKLSFTTLGCPDWTLREIAENAAKMGYDGVDFRGLLSEIDISKLPEFTTGLNETKQLFADHGIAIPGLLIGARYAVADPAEKQKQFDETRRNLELAAKLDSTFLRVYGGRVPEGHTVETIMPYLVENLKEIGEEARQYNIFLAIESHDAWTASDICARVIQAVDHPNVRILWDLHHPYRANGESPEHTYNNLAPYTVNLHVKDSIPLGEGEHRYVLLGEGDVPVKKMLDMLVEGGYNGYACLEWEKRWHPDLPGPEIVFPQYISKMHEWLG